MTYTPEATPQALAESRQYEVRKLSEGVFRVSGKAAERLTLTTDLDTQSGMQYLMARLRGLGVVAALEEKGARLGDRVRLGEVELRWMMPLKERPKRRTAGQRKANAKRMLYRRRARRRQAANRCTCRLYPDSRREARRSRRRITRSRGR